METLFLYFGKVILTSGILFLYYRLFLKDKTFHHYNRFYLLAAVVISVLLPLLKVSYFTLEVNSRIYLLINKLQNFNSIKTLNDDFLYINLILLSVGLVSVFFLARLITGLIKIQSFKKQFPKEHFDGIDFYQTNLQEAPFSFFKNLFWKTEIAIQSDLGRQILKHEMVHIEQKHSWDKIFVELITSVFWFNPLFYYIKKEIHLIHEYLADKKAVKNSDPQAFAQMLLASHFSGKVLQATSPFLSSNLKKRLTMLKKSKTKFSYARRIAALPILFFLTFIYLVNAKNREIKATNLEVEKLISTLKSDTISPRLKEQKIINKDDLEIIQNEIKEKQKANEPLRNAIHLKNDEARKITSELKSKGDALRKLSLKKDFDNPKFSELEKEMNQLGTKMNAIFDSEDFKNKMKALDLNFSEMDKLHAKLDQYYNSEEFTSKIKDAEKRAEEAEKKINSPEFQKRIKDAEKRAKEAEKRINSPEFQKRIKDAEKRAEEAEKKINSPEFQKRIKDAEKRAEEAEKRINSPEFQKRLKEAEKHAENTPSNIIILKSSDHKADNVSDGNIKIYLDGKPITAAEMHKLQPNTIEKMVVNKKGFQGTKSGEIYITSRK